MGFIYRMTSHHDDRLLDQLDDLERHAYDGVMWRAVRKERSVLDSSRGAGRWNTADMNVLYGAQEADGAIAEIHFHLSRGQSVFPSKMQHILYELSVTTDRTLVLANMGDLVRLGVDEATYKQMLYTRTQEIASAAAFLGFDGIIAPNARFDCQNIILMVDQFNVENIEITSERPIDWKSWRSSEY